MGHTFLGPHSRLCANTIDREEAFVTGAAGDQVPLRATLHSRQRCTICSGVVISAQFLAVHMLSCHLAVI